MDTFLFNILEIVHGHRLYNYLSYCSYRFEYRTTKWMSQVLTIDRSISPEHRTIHNFCFSNQFYYAINVISWGILYFSMGIYIIIINNHKLFSDSATIALFCTVWVLYVLVKYGFGKVSGFFDLWKLPNHEVADPRTRVEQDF